MASATEEFRECGVCQRCGVALQYDNYLLNTFGQTMISHLLDDGTRQIKCPDGELHDPEDGWFKQYVTKSATNPSEANLTKPAERVAKEK